MSTKASKTKQLPIIPLPTGQVLLPGVTKRIPISDRPDVLALLRDVYGNTTQDFISNSHVAIGCVPLNPPAPVQFFSDAKDEKHVENEQGIAVDKPKTKTSNEKDRITDKVISAVIAPNPGDARPADLFSYGVVARIVGLEERNAGGFTILVEGVSRFKVGKYTQETPFLRAIVEYVIEDGLLRYLVYS